MVNWRTYKITSRTTNSGYIAFELDGYVTFENGNSRNRIDCVNASPYSSYYSGDYLEIDVDRTVYYSSAHDFNDTSLVRKTSSAVVQGRTIAGELARRVEQGSGNTELEYRIEHKDPNTGKTYMSESYIYRKR